MRKMLCVWFAGAVWILLCAFTPAGIPVLPGGPSQRAASFGLSLSGQGQPCFGCSGNDDEGCYVLGVQAIFAYHFYWGDQLRIKLSAQLAGTARDTSGDHSDHDGNVFLDPGIEYMLSLGSSRLALLLGADLGIFRRNNREEFEVLSFTPYLGGLLALREPGEIRPYFAARLGASVSPRRTLAGNAAAGVQLPLGAASRLSLEAYAGFVPGEDGVVPTAGANLGLIF